MFDSNFRESGTVYSEYICTQNFFKQDPVLNNIAGSGGSASHEPKALGEDSTRYIAAGASRLQLTLS